MENRRAFLERNAFFLYSLHKKIGETEKNLGFTLVW